MKIFKVLLVCFIIWTDFSIAEKVSELSVEQKLRLIDNTHQSREVLLSLIRRGDVTDYQIFCADSINKMSDRINDDKDNNAVKDELSNEKSNTARISNNLDNQLSFSDSLKLVQEFKFLNDDGGCLWLESKLQFVYAAYPVKNPTIRQYLSKIEKMGLDIVDDAIELHRFTPLEIVNWMLSSDYNIPDDLMMKVLDIDLLSEKQAMRLAKVYDFTGITSCICSSEDDGANNSSGISQRKNSDDHAAVFEPGGPLYILHTLFSMFILDRESRGEMERQDTI